MVDGGRRAVVAGIDGGGTKTLCLVYCPSTGAIGLGRGGPLNANYVPREEARQSVTAAVAAACTEAGLGAAGLSSVAVAAPWSEEIVTEAVRSLGTGSTVSAPGEDVTALMGGLLQPHGLVLIAGTGSRCAYVPRGAGEAVVAGAWGSLFGDEGSGYEIGAMALRAVTHASDGRGEATALTPALTREWCLHEPKDLVRRVYGPPPGSWRHRIASLCPLVGVAAAGGDAVALGILDAAAHGLARMVQAVVRRAGLGSPADVLKSGGVFGLGELIDRPLRRSLCELGVQGKLLAPRLPAVYGATLLALAPGGSPPPRAVADLLEHHKAAFPGAAPEVPAARV